MALTFFRTGELIGARWDEFDLEAGLWDIPAVRMKTKTPHTVPPSTPAIAVLRILHGVTGTKDLSVNWNIVQAGLQSTQERQMAKTHANSWEVTDEFWERVEKLVPERVRDPDKQYLRSAGAGRPAKPARLVFEAIVYVLRTGCHWKALPFERFGSASAVHSKFMQWSRTGFFGALWKAGLAEYDELEGIAWRWQSVDGAMFKAPLAQEAVGPNPTDRGKKWQQAPSSGGRAWRPVVARRGGSLRTRCDADQGCA